MLKIIVFYIRNILFLISTVPDIFKVKFLLRQELITEADRIIFNKASYWGKLVARSSNSEVRVTGEENVPSEGVVVFVCNHLSMFDIPILSGFIFKPKAYVAKIELSRVPILSTWMKLMNCVFIDRGNKRNALEAINKGSEILKKGYSMVIFPEGTRSKDGKLLKFKPGSLKLAMNAGAPIVPVTIVGTDKILEAGKHTVEVIISKPIYEAEYSTMDTLQLANLLQNTIAGKKLEAEQIKICV